MKGRVLSHTISSLFFCLMVLAVGSISLAFLFLEAKLWKGLWSEASQRVWPEPYRETDNWNSVQTVADAIMPSSSSIDEKAVSILPSIESIENRPLLFDIPVPFILQAPYSYWGKPYQEACEEASLLMAVKYFAGEQEVTKAAADTEIKQLVAWEKEHFGFYEDTNTEETAQIARLYFQMNADVVVNASVDHIKDELLKGHLVIVPLTGRELQNPYFRGQGPLYHMVVIRGFDDKTQEFITNDPGIGRGKSYRYKYDIIMKSIHDWNNGDIYNGEPMLISIWK